MVDCLMCAGWFYGMVHNEFMTAMLVIECISFDALYLGDGAVPLSVT